MSVGTVQERRLRHLEIANWNEPAGVKPRGTLFLLTGRGEKPEVYTRFATRISADAYRVVVISAADYTTPGARAEIDELINSTDVVEPSVLVGSDVGARAALELAASRTLNIDAVITAGLAIAGAAPIGDRDAEIEARTACPVHRGVLGRATHGTLSTAVGSIALGRPTPTGLDVSVLAIHGAADDAISPLEPAVAFYRNAGVARGHGDRRRAARHPQRRVPPVGGRRHRALPRTAAPRRWSGAVGGPHADQPAVGDHVTADLQSREHAGSGEAEALSAEEFKRVFRRHPAGVAVITLAVGDRLVGFTATSVISVSAEPPLIAFSVAGSSSSWTALALADTVVVNFLTAEQAEVSTRFATSGIDRFAHGGWSLLPTGEPVLDATPRWLRGRIVQGTPSVPATSCACTR